MGRTVLVEPHAAQQGNVVHAGFLRHPDTQLLTQQHLPAAENGSTRPLTDMQIEAYLLHNDMPWLGVY